MAFQTTAFGNRPRVEQKSDIHSATVAAALGRVENGGSLRPALEFPQRQPDEPDVSKPEPGFFAERGGGFDLPSVSGVEAGTVTISIAKIS